MPLEAGDVTIAIAPAGSKSGIGKIIAAIIIVFFILPAIGATVFVGPGMTMMEGIAAAMTTWGGKALAMLALNLSMTGIQQLMAPDPSVDQDNPTNYLFSGGANNAVEGDPIPIMYGELRVPGRPISIDIAQGGNAIQRGGMQAIINNTVVDAANNTNISDVNTQEK